MQFLLRGERYRVRPPTSSLLAAGGTAVMDNLYARRRVAHGEIALGTRRETITRRIRQ